MIILITGASHTGKTLLAQKMLEKYKYPYLSIDHLKMGLIRSGNTDLTPLSDDVELTEYLWPIVSEIIKTAIENEQNLIVEDNYIKQICCYCLVMSEKYIRNNFDDILRFSNIIENRIEDKLNIESVLKDNSYYFSFGQDARTRLVFIDDVYNVEGLII